MNIDHRTVKIKRCIHGIPAGQCHVCNTGPVGITDEQDTTSDNKVDRLKLLKKIGVRINRERREIHEQNILAQCLVPVEDPAVLCGEREGKEMSEVKTKVCRKCGQVKTLTKENYVPNSLCKDGFEGTCKKCKAEHSKARRDEKKAEGIKLKVEREDPPDTKNRTLDIKSVEVFDDERYNLNTSFFVKTSDQDHRFVVGKAYKPFDLSGVIAEYPEVLEKVTDLAKEEMRSVEMQALWLIRIGLAKQELRV
jgi:hypothetical protein